MKVCNKIVCPINRLIMSRVEGEVFTGTDWYGIVVILHFPYINTFLTNSLQFKAMVLKLRFAFHQLYFLPVVVVL